MTVQAADGVIEINQAIVDANGGFPYVISEPGSYKLTGNLTVPDELTSAIEVSADDVTLDLNGFSIIGVVQCTEADGVISCDAEPESGTGGSGVTSPFAARNIVVRNGAIRGMGAYGILISRSALVEGVRALENVEAGIAIGQGVIIGCLGRLNGVGIFVENGIAANNIAVFNRFDGIRVERGVMENNVSESNSRNGIRSIVSALVAKNRVANNGEAALNLSEDSGYADNVIEGTVTGGRPIGCNLIDGVQVCPDASASGG